MPRIHAFLGMALVCVCLASCQGAEKRGEGPLLDKGDDSGCRALVTRLGSSHAEVSLGIERATRDFAQSAERARLDRAKASFGALSGELDALADGVCKAPVEQAARQGYCLEQHSETIRQAMLLMKLLDKAPLPAHFAYLLDSAVAAVREDLSCLERALDSPEAFVGLSTRGGRVIGGPAVLEGDPSSSGGCATSSSGQVKGGALTLVASGSQKLQVCEDLKVAAELICRRRSAQGTYEDLPDCNGASLREGDRFKVAFKADRKAHVYFFLSNSAGQFQMFFPDTTSPNEAEAQVRYEMPPGEDGWIELDEVTGVLEIIQLVVSVQPVRELEDKRGLDLRPQKEGAFHKSVMATRGKLEPLATRGKLEPLATRGPSVMGSKGPTTLDSSFSAEGKDLVAFEFTLWHVE